MIRLSVSDLESLRYWQNDEDSTLEDLLRRLRHEDPPNEAMEAGRAFAKFMEHARAQEVQSAEVDGWEFCFDLEAEMPISPVRELKAEVAYQTPSGPVTLVGMVDGLDGLVVHDQKLTGRWDPEKYMDSLQWRAYLVMFQAEKFRYDIFVGKHQGKRVAVTEFHPMDFWRYPGIEADVQAAVNELAALISEHMPERVAA
jgi:hypothetical protein